MKRLAIAMMFAILAGCGDPNYGKEKPIYTVETDLGLYVGYQQVRLVMNDGIVHDPLYNLVTSVVWEGIYIPYKPDSTWDMSYTFVLRRKYQDNKPIDQEAEVCWGVGVTSTGFSCERAYIPGEIYH